MPRSAEVEAVLERLRTDPDVKGIKELVDGASPEELSFRPAPGEWSIVEILRHLGDTEEMREMRFDRMLGEDNPTLDRVDPKPGERDSEDGRVLAKRYVDWCNRQYERLGKLDEAQWHRIGTQLPDPQVHRTVPTQTSVLKEAGKVGNHAEDHLQHMRKNLAAFKAQRQPV